VIVVGNICRLGVADRAPRIGRRQLSLQHTNKASQKKKRKKCPGKQGSGLNDPAI
jgi:hypothetical protein